MINVTSVFCFFFLGKINIPSSINNLYSVEFAHRVIMFQRAVITDNSHHIKYISI